MVLAVAVLICASALTVHLMSGSSKAVTVITDLKQTDATSDSVTLRWNGTAPKYVLVQLYSSGEVAGTIGTVTSPVTIQSLEAGGRYHFRLYEADEEGKRLSEDDPGVCIRDVRTLPAKQAVPSLDYYYRSSNGVDFSWPSDSFSDGYQLRVEDASGKKLAVKTVSGSAVSGSAAESIVQTTIRPSYRGRVVRVRVRGYITLDGKKKYSEEWSDPRYYAAAKKIKLSGSKDAIRVSGVKVKGAVKKVIYVSKKKKKGYRQAAKLGAKETKCKFTEYGGKSIVSDKKYYVRIFYYYKVDGKLQESPVYDEGRVYVKPTYFYLDV